MASPSLRCIEWFLKNIVDRRMMEELVKRITRFYDKLYMEIVYRTHYNSFKVMFADVFSMTLSTILLRVVDSRNGFGNTYLKNQH